MVPPHILESIAINAEKLGPEADEIRRRTLEHLSISNSLLTARVARSETLGRTQISRIAKPFLRSWENRNIYDLNHQRNLPGTLERTEGEPPVNTDDEVNKAYENLGAVYDFFWQIYHRNSVDDRGLTLNALIHYGSKYSDAFWDGKQILLGDGDGVLFKSFVSPLDVTGHEFTHGVTQYEANLIY